MDFAAEISAQKVRKIKKSGVECEIFVKNNKKFIDKKNLVLYNEITVYNVILINKRKADLRMTNYFAAIDIFNLSAIGCGIFLGVVLLLAVLMAVLRCRVIYFDSEDGNREIHNEKHSWLSKVGVHGANKKGKRLVGWSKKPNGEKPLTTHKIVLFHTVKLYAIWADAPYAEPAIEKPAAPVEELDYTQGIIVKFNYIDTQTDEVIASEGYRLNAVIPEEEVEGWGFAPDGAVVLATGTENYVFSINLYPVRALEDSDVPVSDEEFTGEAVVDLSYTLAGAEKAIYKESHYLKLKNAGSYAEDDKFLGWSVVPDGDVVIERGDIDTIFTIPLYAIEAAAQEEPAIEPEVEIEVVEEPIVEEPVAEEPKPLYEEVIEEYIPQPVEEVIEEPVAEEIVEEVVEEPVVEEPVEEVVEEPAIEEPVAEEPAPAPAEEAEPVLIPTYFDNEGNKIDIKFSRSFTANLIQSEDTVKDYYSELKNHILSYKGVKSRISWKFDSYNRGRDQLFKVKLRGKTICLYCALDPNEFDEAKYHHEPIDAKIFEDVPMLVKIKSGLGLRKAKELVDITMAKFGIEKDEKAKTVDYVAKYPYEPNEPLIARKLIKLLIADDAVVVMSTKPKEEPVVEEVVEVIPEPIVEEAIEEVVEEPVVEVIEEPVVEVVEEPVEEVVEEPAIEEPVIEEIEEEPYVEPEVVVESVSAEDAHQIVEEKQVEIHVEESVDYIGPKDNKKAIINIDTLSSNYEAHEVVNIQSMKDKKLIDKKAKCVKVLARGILNKPLRIKAGEFSRTAVEMILLTGGQAIHVEYRIKK